MITQFSLPLLKLLPYLLWVLFHAARAVRAGGRTIEPTNAIANSDVLKVVVSFARVMGSFSFHFLGTH